MTTKKKPAGIVLYAGPSALDGAPIAVIATLNSKNVKTGNMVQTWIIRTDVSPIEASKQALDSSICGTCPHRQSLGGACYVNLGQAPMAVYRAFHRGIYPQFDLSVHADLFAGRFIRFGSYGDPAAAPVGIWSTLATLSSGWTGYTHQIAHKNFDADLLKYCMVSADTPRSAAAHHKANRRTFRVKTADAPLLENEIVCPSEQGVLCADCRACSGAASEGLNIAIEVHGSLSKRYESKYRVINLKAVS